MLQTARAILKRDPAAHSLLAVILTYPGFRALFWHRLAHALDQRHHYLVAGLISQHAAKVTGISIAPAAQIGQRVFIDHGIGVVIGATAVIEDDVTLLHGVTLGARHNVTKTGRRHPIVKRGAFIGANAQILGTVTIGEGGKVGAGAVVLQDVSAGDTAVGNPARMIHHPTKVMTLPINQPDQPEKQREPIKLRTNRE